MPVKWVPKSEISYDKVLKDLRVVGKSHQGPVYFDNWYIKEGFVGLPGFYAQELGYETGGKTTQANWGRISSYRNDQESVIKEVVSVLRKENTTLMTAPPGWGKTVAGCDIAARMGLKTLVIADQLDLLGQWQTTARELFSTESGRIQGKKWDYSKPLTVSTIQTLARNLDRLEELADQFGLIIVDEAHTFSTASFYEIMPYMQAKYQLGVSATFRRTDNLERVYHQHFGEVTVDGKKPPANAVYFSPEFKLNIKAEEYMRSGDVNFAALITAIATNKAYNEWLAKSIKTMVERGHQVVLLTHRVEQTQILQRNLQSLGQDAKIYVGEGKLSVSLEEARKSPVILTTIKKFAKGVDVPTLSCLFLATPISDPEQAVGRVTRDLPGKQQQVIVDPMFRHPMLIGLWKKRVKIYTQIGIKEKK